MTVPGISLTLLERVLDAGQPEAASGPCAQCFTCSGAICMLFMLRGTWCWSALPCNVRSTLVCECGRGSGTVQDTSAVPAQCPRRTLSSAGHCATSATTESRHRGRGGAMCLHVHVHVHVTKDGRVLNYAM